MTTLSLLNQKHRKSYILKLKNKNQLDFNKISEDMNNKEKELLSQINEFKKDVIDLENNHEKILNKYWEYKKVNDFFSEMYKKIQNSKKNKRKNLFIENKSNFSLINQYLLKNKRLPDMSRNIFNLNPLILDNDQLKNFFIYNKIDPSKFFEYLNKVKDMIDRKIDGNRGLNEEEKKHLDDIIKNEKPKGYVEPEVLIRNLKKDIAITKKTFNYLINKNMKRTLEDPNNKNIIKKIDSFDEIKKLDTSKKIKFVNDNKNKNNFNNYINKSFIDSTTVPLESKNINILTPRFEIFNRKKTQTQTNIFISHLLSKRKNNSTLNIFDLFNNELDNSNSINEKNFGENFNNINEKNSNNFLKRSFNKNLRIDKELNNFSLFQNNKSELFSPSMKMDFNEFIDNFSNKQEINYEKEQDLKNDNSFFSNSNFSNKNRAKKINFKFDFFKKRMPIILSKKNKKEGAKTKNQSIEKLYNKALKLKLKSKSFDEKVELENYLLSKTKNKNLSQIMNLKNTYYNIDKIERKFIKTNLIKKQYSLRNLKGDKINEQKRILDKNKTLIKSFMENANRLRKVICERNKNDND